MSMDIETFGERLSDEDLVEMVRARRDERSALGALKELSRRESPRRPDIFREVLDDPGQGARAKKTVVVQLGTERLRENQELLLRHLDAKDPSLFAGIVQSLGKIGDEQALQRLEETEAPDDATARRSLGFARSLLAYRLRLDRNLIEPPPDADLVEVTGGITFETARADAETMREALEQVKKHLPAVPLAEEGAAVKLTCRSIELLLVFTEELREPKSLETIRYRSALPLVLLKTGLSLERYFLEQYFFTQPAGDREGVALLGVRPRGELTYAGKTQISEKGFTFTLKSVDTRYAPAIEVEGRYDPDERSWEFTKAVTSTRVAGRESTAGTPRRASPSFR